MANNSEVGTHYEIPSYINSDGSFANNHTEVLNHLEHVLESSKAFMRSNRTWKVAEICRKLLFGDDRLLRAFDKVGVIEINKLRRQMREIIGNAANIRPNFSIRTPKSDNTASDKAATYEELKQHWWYDRFVDRTFKEAIQEASAGLGYMFLWPKRDPNTGKIEIQAKALSYKEGFPYQIAANNNIDSAYSFTVWCETPIAEFREEFPTFKYLKEDRNAPTYIGKRFKNATNAYGGIRGHLRRGVEKRTDSVIDPSFPTKDIFYTWTRDNTINKSGKVVRMGTLLKGDLAGHESYEVPTLNEDMSNIEEARLFPFRRLTIWTKEAILYDGPPKWITNCVPVADFRFERLPKEYMGVPIPNDGRNLEDTINRLITSIVDRIHASANFPIGIDESLPKHVVKILEKKGLRGLVGKAVRLSFRFVNKPIQALFDKDLFKVERHEFEIITSLMELQDYVTGTNDYSNLQRKNQVPAADTQEALVQNLGVLSVDHEREISLGILRFGRIWLQLAPQVYTLNKRISVVGANAVDVKDMDYDPENIVPSPDPKAQGKPYWKRLVEHLEKFSLFAVPGSLQERQSTTNKLTLLQLLKSGGRIADEEIYDKFIGDGRFKEVKDKWTEEQKEKARLAAEIRKEVEAIASAGMSPEGGPLIQQISQLLGQQNTMNEGRPPSNATPPRMEIKNDEDGVQRSTSATN